MSRSFRHEFKPRPMSIPMLADFGVRLACGLAILLLFAPWRLIPPAFFRTHALVILGLLVMAVLDLAGRGPLAAISSGAAVLAFLGSVLWGLGLPRLAIPTTVLIVLASAAVLFIASQSTSGELWALHAAGRLSSAFLMGATLTAMLLGHYYLTAPAMSIEPLKRFVRCMAWALGVRLALGALGWWLWHEGIAGSPVPGQVSPFFLSVRWGMGFAAPALATWMAWKTVAIRSTQSATGILYIAMTFVLFGELTALILARGSGAAF
jgi:hypothetical protein